MRLKSYMTPCHLVKVMHDQKVEHPMILTYLTTKPSGWEVSMHEEVSKMSNPRINRFSYKRGFNIM